MLEVGGVEAKLGAKVDQRGFREFDAYMAKADKKEATATIKVDTDKSAFSQADRALGNIEKKVSDLGGGLGRFNRNFTAFRNGWKLIKWPAIITGFGLATQAANALAAGAVALTASLAPLGGLLVEYPALLSAFGQAAGVVALSGMKDLTQALGGNEQALKRLTPEARKFMQTLQTFKPQYDKLKESVQAPLFAGLERGLRSAMGSFEPFRRGMNATAKVMGALAADAGKLIGSKGFGRDLGSIMDTNTHLIDNLGHGFLSLFSALRHVLVVAEPLTKWLGRLGLELGQHANRAAKAGRETGALSRFFHQTRVVAERLGHTLGELGKGLVNIGKMAVPLGDSMWKAIDRVATRFEEWTGSLQGKITLAAYFQAARAPLAEMGKLVLAVGQGLLDIGTMPGLAPLIKQVREELLPVLVSVIETTTRELGPTLVTLATNIGKIAQALVGASGPLKTTLQVLTAITGVVADLIDSNPAIATTVSTLAGLGSVISALGLASFLSHLLGFRRGFGVAQTAAKSFFDYLGKTDLGSRAYVMASDFVQGFRLRLTRGRAAVSKAARALMTVPRRIISNVAETAAGQWIGDSIGRIRAGQGRFSRIGRLSGSWIGKGLIIGAITFGLVEFIPKFKRWIEANSGRWRKEGIDIGKIIGEAITWAIKDNLHIDLNVLKGAGPEVGGGQHVGDVVLGALGQGAKQFAGPLGGALPHFGGLAREGFASGGWVNRRARHPEDTLPAWLTPGEFVMKKKIVDRVGAARLYALNRGEGLNAGGMVGKKPGDADVASLDRTKKMRRDVTKEWEKLDKDHDDKTKRMRDRTKKRFSDMRDQGRDRSQEMAKAVGKSMGSLDSALFKGLDYIGSATNRALGAFKAKAIDYTVPNPPGFAGGGFIQGQGRGDTVPLLLGMAAPDEAVLTHHQQDETDYALAITKALGLGRFGSLDELFAGVQKRHDSFARGGKIGKVDLRGPVPFEIPGQGGLDAVRRTANKYIKKHGGLGRVVSNADRMDALHRSYLWGGGHGGTADVNGPWDCSGAISELLAGSVVPGFSPTVSGGFMGLFSPGKDPEGLTISANTEHVFSTINVPGKGLRAFGTSDENPGGGAGWIDGYQFRPGFALRHVPIDQMGQGGGGVKGKGQEKVPGFAAGGRLGPHVPARPAIGGHWLKGIGGNWDPSEVFTGIRQLGGSKAAARYLSGKVMGESRGNARAVQPGGLGRGLLQIDLGQHPEYQGWNLMNPWENMVAALQVYAGNPTGWAADSTAPGHLLWDRIKGSDKKKPKGKGKQPGNTPTNLAPEDDGSPLAGLVPLLLPSFSGAEAAFANAEPGLSPFGPVSGAVDAIRGQLGNDYAQLSRIKSLITSGDARAAKRAQRVKHAAPGQKKKMAAKDKKWKKKGAKLAANETVIEQAIADLTEGKGAEIADLAWQYAGNLRGALRVQQSQAPILAGARGTFARGGRVGGGPPIMAPAPQVHVIVEEGAGVDHEKIRVVADDAAATREQATSRRFGRARQTVSAPGRVASYGRRR